MFWAAEDKLYMPNNSSLAADLLAQLMDLFRQGLLGFQEFD